jgi:hypothetical protein
MLKGSADEAVVTIKSLAYENAVTYLRIKLEASDREQVEVKGGTSESVEESGKAFGFEAREKS